MANSSRRSFLQASAALAGSFCLPPRGKSATQPNSRIEVLAGEPIATIAPEIYGHFTEHLGGVVYDGMWVGTDSKIPNEGGIRTALTDKLKQIQAPLIRWPGGCFADSYDWKDGIGPRAKRPSRTNFWEVDATAKQLPPSSVQLYENNAFGTSEFVRFCKMSGAEPYIAANLRSLPALDFDHWIEYCNSPAGSTTLARTRETDGSREPFGVRYWGVGNESWGCGGEFTPEEYGAEFHRFTSWVPKYGVDLRFVASGPNSDELEWTEGFLHRLTNGRPGRNLDRVWAFSIHHYAWNLSRGRTTEWVAGKGDALQFDPVDWYELLRESDRMEKLVRDHWTILSRYDPKHIIGLAVDEYGPWYKPGTELERTHLLGQQVTLRDALATALTLDIFNRNAEKVRLGACAQLVNCLNSLFFAHEDRFIVTPNFYVFNMYAAHQNAKAVRAEFSAPTVSYTRDGKAASFWGLKGSASVKGQMLTLTVVNPHVSEACETEIAVRGAAIRSGKANVLSHPDIHAHNTFAAPDVVRPQEKAVTVSSGRCSFTFPASSVTQLTMMLS